MDDGIKLGIPQIQIRLDSSHKHRWKFHTLMPHFLIAYLSDKLSIYKLIRFLNEALMMYNKAAHGAKIISQQSNALGIFLVRKAAIYTAIGKQPTPKPSHRKGTKQAIMIKMMHRPDGASIEEICAQTGWQKHMLGACSQTRLKNV